jgi:hypothetical protein
VGKIPAATVINNVYTFDDGSSLRREHTTTTPNGILPRGESISGRWVYRNSHGDMLGFNKYINDIAEQFGLELFNIRGE